MSKNAPEPDKMVLTWQTINKLNKLELENSLLKETLASLTVQMTALKEEQKQFFQMAETTMSRLDLSVSDFNGRIDSLSAANRQLQRGINAAMSRASDQMLEQYTKTLDTAKLDLANRSASYISQLENISRRASKTFEAAEKRVLGFTERHVWLTLAFCGSLVGHLIGCIQWIQTLF
jgi:exonuclease VII small subunit